MTKKALLTKKEKKMECKTDFNRQAYQNWLDFSTRLVTNVYRLSKERRAKMLEEIREFIQDFKGLKIHPWNGYSKKFGSISDYAEECFEEYEVVKYGERGGKYYQDVMAALKAGLDVALPEYATSGVLGFSVGDVRKAFPEGIPDYVHRYFEMQYQPFGCVILPNVPDGEGIWL